MNGPLFGAVTTNNATASGFTMLSLEEIARSLPPPDPDPVVRIDLSVDLLDALRSKAGGQFDGNALNCIPVRMVEGVGVAKIIRRSEEKPDV